jgi:transposase
VEELTKVKRPFAVCFEASTGYGHLYDQMARVARRVVVAHPGHLRLIFRSKRKNDRVDAQKLATLLLVEAVHPVHVPSQDVRAWRGMIEHRQRQVQGCTRIKNALRALVRSQGIVAPRGLWSRRGRVWLRELALPHPLDAVRRDDLVERLQGIEHSIRRVEKVLNALGRRHPGVQLLRSIPGVGPRTAEAVVAYIDDPRRFTRSKAIGSYFGLVPCLDASADRSRYGHITREGPRTVRRLLVEAAWQGIRRSPRIGGYFERIRQGNPERRKIAVAATAHYLLRVMLAMLQTGECWRPEAA